MEARKKYGKSFDIISAYNRDIADYIKLDDFSRIAVDWLAESISSGKEIEMSAIYYSDENKILPYFCEAEEETYLFEREENPLQNSILGIENALRSYKYSEACKNENKFSFWKNLLLELAREGNFMAQALICWSWSCGQYYSDVIMKVFSQKMNGKN